MHCAFSQGHQCWIAKCSCACGTQQWLAQCSSTLSASLTSAAADTFARHQLTQCAASHLRLGAKLCFEHLPSQLMYSISQRLRDSPNCVVVQVKRTCYAQSSQIREIRKKMTEIMTREASSCDLKELVGKFIPESIGAPFCCTLASHHSASTDQLYCTRHPAFCLHCECLA